jgi:hypothetical protein
MAALLADGPGRPLQQRPEIIIQDTVGAANDLLSHFEPSALSPCTSWPARDACIPQARSLLTHTDKPFASLASSGNISSEAWTASEVTGSTLVG